ncbi:MAG: chromate transporter [Bacteroidales bacterium]|nr:chromate transporter [Bacteroidales bacterium]MBQ6177832.1 chromate transporter [Bacteroidales bacterium]
MIYAELLIGFLKVGCFSFGGAYAAIPLIRDVVLSAGWLTEEALTDMIAVSESTPGPIMVNLATYIGSSRAGFAGALLATSAVVLPAFVIILLIMAVMKRTIKNRYVQAVMKGLTACVTGVILVTGGWMVYQNGFRPLFAAEPDVRPVILTAVLAAIWIAMKLKLKKKASPIGLILIAAVLGAAMYAI